MERAGRTETEIYEVTGWFRWHGTWVREFSDRGVQLRPEARAALKETGGAKGRGRTVRQPAASLFSAPEIWRRYPELAHLTVELSRQRTIADVAAMRESGFGSGRGPEGSSTPSRPAFAEMEQGNIRIVADTPEEAAAKFIIEVNRFIARIEGLPEGGTPESAMEAVGRMWRSLAADEAGIAERMAALVEGQDAGASRGELDFLAEELAKVQAMLERLETVYPEAAYAMLAATQAGEAMARRLRMTPMQRQAAPFLEAMDIPPEEQLVTRRGPARQFGVGDEDVAPDEAAPVLWTARDVLAPLSPAVREWAGLHDLPLNVRITHILENRGRKTARGKYGPNGDLHTLEQIHAHIERVTADPDFAWVSANRDGTFSMNLAKIEEGFVRIVPVSLSPPRDGQGLIPTIFNEFLPDVAWRITSAWNQEGERGVKWKQTPAGRRLVLHLLEQASDDKRTSAWFKLRGLLHRSQSAAEAAAQSDALAGARPRRRREPTPSMRDEQGRIYVLNPYQEELFAEMHARGASTDERLEAFRQMVGSPRASERTMFNYLRDMERRGLVTLERQPPDILARITPEQEQAYIAVYRTGVSPGQRLAVFRRLTGEEQASRSSMYRLERRLAERGLITLRKPGGAPGRAAESPAPGDAIEQEGYEAFRAGEISETLKVCKS
jgi:hypothetical protein